LPQWILNNLSRGDQQPIVNVVATAVMVFSIVPVWLAQRLTGGQGAVSGR
jgi:putative spermidine/putrescine transport system permease protein